jgi:starch-binding outer membrane protein, SusD/RagB family
MKKIFIYIFSIVMISSCESELDQKPISSSTTTTFYQTKVDFIQGVNAVYSSLRTYPERQLNLSETRSDNLYAVSDGGVRDWEGINSFHKTISTNPYINEAWLTNLNAIHKANIVLEQLQKNGSIITETELRTRLEAEARFLRAFHYFDMVRWFGKVPMVDHPVLPEEALEIPRSPVEEVYNFIISDLEFAVESLPESYSAKTDLGRATKNAARGILALVYMTRSGSSYGIEGPGMGLNEWDKASVLLDAIIGSGKNGFLPAYKDIFSYTNENNREVIFDVQYMSGGLGLGASFLWLLVPEGYFNSFGLPNQGGISIRPVSTDLVNSYEGGDLRKSFSIANGYTFNGTTETRPFFVKYVDVTKYGTSRTDWPINFIILRYTDVLMMKAECILHGASGTQADVDKIVNDVRTRAGLSTPVSGVTLEMLMEERRREFAGEGLRWHDLVRSGLVDKKIPDWIAAEDVQKQMQPFQTDFIIYPIPQAEVDVRENLYSQNKGY